MLVGMALNVFKLNEQVIRNCKENVEIGLVGHRKKPISGGNMGVGMGSGRASSNKGGCLSKLSGSGKVYLK